MCLTYELYTNKKCYVKSSTNRNFEFNNKSKVIFTKGEVAIICIVIISTITSVS